MKIVFLDVDGELTYSNYENEETEDIDPEKVKLLKEICDFTHAKVVISSSWRGTENHTPQRYSILLKILKNNAIEVIDDIPYIEPEYEVSTSGCKGVSLVEPLSYKIKYGTGRAAEVQRWLSLHDVDRFVILDDEDWDWASYGYEKYWIQPTWFGDGGLKPEHVVKAIEILEGEKYE